MGLNSAAEKQKGRVECLKNKMDGERAFINSILTKSISVFVFLCSQFTANLTICYDSKPGSEKILKNCTFLETLHAFRSFKPV